MTFGNKTNLVHSRAITIKLELQTSFLKRRASIIIKPSQELLLNKQNHLLSSPKHRCVRAPFCKISSSLALPALPLSLPIIFQIQDSQNTIKLSTIPLLNFPIPKTLILNLLLSLIKSKNLRN